MAAPLALLAKHAAKQILKNPNRRGPVLGGIAIIVAMAVLLAFSLVGGIVAGFTAFSGSASAFCDGSGTNSGPVVSWNVSGGLDDIPAMAVSAYEKAGAATGLDWTFIAGIGREESNHGGGHLQPNGDVNPPIYGPPTAYGRAEGPMQFLPSTFASYAHDGNGDGVSNIQNIFDAAQATAFMMKANGAPNNWNAAIYAYNHADWYVTAVMNYASQYRADADKASSASPAATTSAGGLGAAPTTATATPPPAGAIVTGVPATAGCCNSGTGSAAPTGAATTSAPAPATSTYKGLGPPPGSSPTSAPSTYKLGDPNPTAPLPAATSSAAPTSIATTAPNGACDGGAALVNVAVGPGGWTNPNPGAVLTSGFSPNRKNPVTGVVEPHLGQDLGQPCGSPIYAAHSGTITKAGPSTGFGDAIFEDIGGGVTLWYGHEFDNGLLVKVGQQVTAGQEIGLVGSNGQSTGCHDHFQVNINGTPTDPVPFMQQMGAPL